MKEIDYLIVGLGIAGICFCEQLEKGGKSFLVFDAGGGATTKSGGVFNPTVLKRFTAVWKSQQFFEYAHAFYENLSKKLGFKIINETSILRIFKSVEEQNNWSVASDSKELQNFISSEFIVNSNACINAPLGFGLVKNTGHIDAPNLLASFSKHLISKNVLVNDSFEYKLIEEIPKGFQYKDIQTKNIVFCEGTTAVENPFFPKNALVANKGEYLIIHSPKLKLEKLLKGPLYVIPIGNNNYKVGATYSRDDDSLHTTEAARNEILKSLKTFLKCPFEIIGQEAGVRPTTRDRRPILGSLKNNDKYFFNGLGSRGFLMAPLLSEMLYEYVENKSQLLREIDINRFV